MFIQYSFIDNKLEVQHSCNNKFNLDSILYEDSDFQIYTYGYFLNSESLFKEYAVDALPQLLLALLHNHAALSEKLKSTYLIVVQNKHSHNISIYNDLLSKESLFYFVDNNTFAASNDYYQLLDFCKQSKIALTIDSLGLKMMTHTQVFYDDVTYFNEIKFLKPLEYITIADSKFQIQHIGIPLSQTSMAEEDVIAKMDQLFKTAVAEQYNKNLSYGYDTLCTLSGGMDSRAVLMYLRQLDKSNKIKCFCFGETGSLDNIVSNQIALDYDYPLFFHSLNAGGFIKQRDAMADALRGQMYYAGTTGLYDSLSMYDLSKVGIIHSGIAGGEILGDNCQDEQSDSIAWQNFTLSLELNDVEKERMKHISSSYTSYNQFICLNETRRCVASQKMAKDFNCEYCSPFLDEHFFLFMLTVPYAMKRKRSLYVNWQKKCNPEMFNYQTTHWRGAAMGNEFSFQVRRAIQFFLKRIVGKIKADMNPFFYWEKVNPSIGTYLSDTFQLDKEELKAGIAPELYTQIESDWSHSDLFGKMALLTCTRTLLHYFR